MKLKNKNEEARKRRRRYAVSWLVADVCVRNNENNMYFVWWNLSMKIITLVDVRGGCCCRSYILRWVTFLRRSKMRCHKRFRIQPNRKGHRSRTCATIDFGTEERVKIPNCEFRKSMGSIDDDDDNDDDSDGDTSELCDPSESIESCEGNRKKKIERRRDASSHSRKIAHVATVAIQGINRFLQIAHIPQPIECNIEMTFCSKFAARKSRSWPHITHTHTHKIPYINAATMSFLGVHTRRCVNK